MKTKMRLCDIIIPEDFEKYTPREEKMQECRTVWNNSRKQDRYVVVNNDKVLIDRYVQYLILKENGMKTVQVQISNTPKKRWRRKNTQILKPAPYLNELTTYVYGTHDTDINKKEYVWRVPKKWAESGWADYVNPGDKVMVNTEYGVGVITVTRIEEHDKCPVNLPVKKVVGKLKENKE